MSWYYHKLYPTYYVRLLSLLSYMKCCNLRKLSSYLFRGIIILLHTNSRSLGPLPTPFDSLRDFACVHEWGGTVLSSPTLQEHYRDT